VCSVQLLICFIPRVLGQAEGQGYVFVTHQAPAAQKHSPSYQFLISYFSFTESFHASPCPHWKENQNISHDHDALFPSSSYQRSLSQPPLQGMVAST